MGLTVVLDRMIHAQATHTGVNKTIGLEGGCAYGGKGEDFNPADLLATGVAACLLIVMAKAATAKGFDLTGTWADVSYALKDYKITSVAIAIHSPLAPSTSARKMLEEESYHCPVYQVVKAGTEVQVAFAWGSAAPPSMCGCKGACGK